MPTHSKMSYVLQRESQELHFPEFPSLSFLKNIDLREAGRGGGERRGERNIDLLFHPLMHTLVDSCMCPDWGLSPQPWHIGMIL